MFSTWNYYNFLGEHSITTILLSLACWVPIRLPSLLSGHDQFTHLPFLAATTGCLAPFLHCFRLDLAAFGMWRHGYPVFGVCIGKRLVMVHKDFAFLICVNCCLLLGEELPPVAQAAHPGGRCDSHIALL